jgi:hypothetical protein
VVRSETVFTGDDYTKRISGVIDYLSDGTTRERTVRRNSAGRPLALE